MSILSLILAIPIFGALLIAFIPSDRSFWIRGVAMSAVGSTLLLGLGLLWGFDPESSAVQFALVRPWNSKLGSYFALGLDGFSLPMVLLSCLLSFIAILASFGQTNRVRGYHICLLLLQFGMLGVFMAQDWALFYVFWEVTLIPLFFLIDQWGGGRRHTASLNFVLYTMGGSVFMLVSLLMIYAASVDQSTTMEAMGRAASRLDRPEQILVFLGLMIGFGVKMPVFPLHGWLPLAHVEAPSPVSILLSGVLLKMGAYGIFRSIAMLPEATLALQPFLAALALASILYGGLLAWRQSDLKSMIAYSSISHMGVILLGIASLNPAGLLGASLQMSAHGLVAGSLFLCVGLLYERTHTRELPAYAALTRVGPRFAFFLILALLSSLGLPGLAGFTAEVHVFAGGLERWGGWMTLFGLGILIGAAYALRTIGWLSSGPVSPRLAGLQDLKGHEMLAAGLLGLGTLALGLVPGLALAMIQASVASLAASLGPSP